jgi:hypothetical protein
MKFMLLVHHDEGAFMQFSEATRTELLAESVQLTHQLHADQQYVSASPLHPAASSVIVRVRDGKPFVTDGPFIERGNNSPGISSSTPRISTRPFASPPEFPGPASERWKCGR